MLYCYVPCFKFFHTSQTPFLFFIFYFYELCCDGFTCAYCLYLQGSEKLLELVSDSSKNQNSPEKDHGNEAAESDSENETHPPLVNYTLQSLFTKAFDLSQVVFGI